MREGRRGGKMKLLKRIFGICETSPPSDEGSWAYENHEISVKLGQMRALENPGGAVRLEGKGLPERILLLHGADGQFYAFANKCTHMGRRLDPLPGQDAIQCCSVSKSTFTYAGELVSGAAKNSLHTFPVVAENEELKIKLQ